MSTSGYSQELVRRDTGQSHGRFARLPSAQRLFDVAVSVIALAIASPVFLAVMIAIWLETGRPFFFSQQRLGYRGATFRIFKFRKFPPRSSPNGLPLTIKNDNRMTPVGRVLEKTKLDELPQLWNVLRGDMSFVGPRPETPNFADCFEPEFRQVLNHRPGILGPSQALFRNESALYPEGADPVAYYRAVLFPAKARIDLAYYPASSVASDLGWIVLCVAAVLGVRPKCPLELHAVATAEMSEGAENRGTAELIRKLTGEREAVVSTVIAVPSAVAPSLMPAVKASAFSQQAEWHGRTATN